MRIRLPGGILTAAQLRTLAVVSRTCADGELEITSRANLQLRALTPATLPRAIAALTAAGLLPSRTHDRIRNLVTSPFAGLDPQEHLDTRPYLHALDQALQADPLYTQLHPKFSFGLFGGGPSHTPEPDDLALHALTPTNFRLSVAGLTTAVEIPADKAIQTLLTLATRTIQLARQHNQPTRTKHLLNHLAIPLLPTPYPLLPGSHPVPPTPGTLLPTIPLGRLTHQQATTLADLAELHQLDLRTAPWRGMVLANIPPSHSAAIEIRLTQVNLPPQSTYRGLNSCAGLTGCNAALADVRADAHTLAHTLAQTLTTTQLPPTWSVNLSACEKQCARRHTASADLTATPAGYRLTLAGQVQPGFFTSPQAIAAIAQQAAGA